MQEKPNELCTIYKIDSTGRQLIEELVSQALQKRDSELLERIKFDMKGRNSLIVEIDDIEQILKDINSNN